MQIVKGHPIEVRELMQVCRARRLLSPLDSREPAFGDASGVGHVTETKPPQETMRTKMRRLPIFHTVGVPRWQWLPSVEATLENRSRNDRAGNLP